MAEGSGDMCSNYHGEVPAGTGITSWNQLVPRKRSSTCSLPNKLYAHAIYGGMINVRVLYESFASLGNGNILLD